MRRRAARASANFGRRQHDPRGRDGSSAKDGLGTALKFQGALLVSARCMARRLSSTSEEFNEVQHFVFRKTKRPPLAAPPVEPNSAFAECLHYTFRPGGDAVLHDAWGISSTGDRVPPPSNVGEPSTAESRKRAARSSTSRRAKFRERDKLQRLVRGSLDACSAACARLATNAMCRHTCVWVHASTWMEISRKIFLRERASAFAWTCVAVSLPCVCV